MPREKIMNRVNRECFVLPPVSSSRTSTNGHNGFLFNSYQYFFFWLPLKVPDFAQFENSAVMNCLMNFTSYFKKIKISRHLVESHTEKADYTNPSLSLISSMSITDEFSHHQPGNNKIPKNLEDTKGIIVYLCFLMIWLHSHPFPEFMLSRSCFAFFWHAEWKAFQNA